MKIEIDVPPYDGEGIVTGWDAGFSVAVHFEGEGVIVTANQAGLRSLARHLLVLAQDDVPAGAHVHLDSSNALEDDSIELIVARA